MDATARDAKEYANGYRFVVVKNGVRIAYTVERADAASTANKCGGEALTLGAATLPRIGNPKRTVVTTTKIRKTVVTKTKPPKTQNPEKKVPRPTDLNMMTLADLFGSADRVANQVRSTDAAHIRRCMAAGYLEAEGRAFLILTPAGKAALAAYHKSPFGLVQATAVRRRNPASSDGWRDMEEDVWFFYRGGDIVAQVERNRFAHASRGVAASPWLWQAEDASGVAVSLAEGKALAEQELRRGNPGSEWQAYEFAVTYRSGTIGKIVRFAPSLAFARKAANELVESGEFPAAKVVGKVADPRIRSNNPQVSPAEALTEFRAALLAATGRPWNVKHGGRGSMSEYLYIDAPRSRLTASLTLSEADRAALLSLFGGLKISIGGQEALFWKQEALQLRALPTLIARCNAAALAKGRTGNPAKAGYVAILNSTIVGAGATKAAALDEPREYGGGKLERGVQVLPASAEVMASIRDEQPIPWEVKAGVVVAAEDPFSLENTHAWELERERTAWGDDDPADNPSGARQRARGTRDHRPGFDAPGSALDRAATARQRGDTQGHKSALWGAQASRGRLPRAGNPPKVSPTELTYIGQNAAGAVYVSPKILEWLCEAGERPVRTALTLKAAEGISRDTYKAIVTAGNASVRWVNVYPHRTVGRDADVTVIVWDSAHAGERSLRADHASVRKPGGKTRNPLVRGGTFVGDGALRVVPKTLPKAEIYVYASSKSGTPCAAFFYGKSDKPRWQHSFRDEAGREKMIKETIASLQYKEDKKAANRQEAADFQHNIKKGDVFAYSWGYDQTNIEFFVVVAVRDKTVSIQECGSKIVESNSAADKVQADPSKRFGEVLTKRPQAGYKGHAILTMPHGIATLVSPGDVSWKTSPYAGH